ncbi:MAG: tetratricopeptide repeat protein [Candidatus Krumholzibacteriia bacterium]
MNVKKECIRILLGLLLVLLAMNVHAAAGAGEAGTLMSHARAAAERDQHRQAIDFFRRAIASDPSRSGELAAELGDQYTWAEIPDSAIVWYEVALARNADDIDALLGAARAHSWAGRHREAERRYLALLPASGERREDVLIGLAKVKSWQGDLGEAESVYLEVLDSNPASSEARLGLAEVANWSGQHRRAETLYRDELSRDPNSGEARRGLAYAQYWSGQSFAALQTLRAGDGDGQQTLESEIRGERHVRGASAFSFRDNSTDGDFSQFESSVTIVPVLETEVKVAYARGHLTLAGSPDIDRDQLSVIFHKRLSSVLAVSLGPGLQRNDFDRVTLAPNNALNDDFDVFIWDVYGTLTPSDWVRVDAGNARQTLDIPQTLFRDIRVTETSVGVDWRLRHRLMTFWALQHDAYSDTNSRVAFSGRAEYTPRVEAAGRWRNAFAVSSGIEYWDFEQQLDHGYFSPLTYAHVFGGLGFAADLTKRVRLEVAGRVGFEKEKGEGWANVGSFDGAVRVKTGGSVFVGAGYSGSGSRLDSADGFRSRSFYVSVDYPLGR